MGDAGRRRAVLFHGDRDGAHHADDVVKTGIAADETHKSPFGALPGVPNFRRCLISRKTRSTDH